MKVDTSTLFGPHNVLMQLLSILCLTGYTAPTSLTGYTALTSLTGYTALTCLTGYTALTCLTGYTAYNLPHT